MKTAAIIVAGIVAGAILGVAAMWVDVAQAAPSVPDTVPVSDNCVLDSTIGVLTVFYCESDAGVDYLINSFGFVVVVD